MDGKGDKDNSMFAQAKAHGRPSANQQAAGTITTEAVKVPKYRAVC